MLDPKAVEDFKRDYSLGPERLVMEAVESLWSWYVLTPGWAKTLYFVRARFLVPALEALTTRRAASVVEGWVRKRQPYEPLRHDPAV